MTENVIPLSRDIRDAKPFGSRTLMTKDCDPSGDCASDCGSSGDCASSCSSCESSSAASCGTCEGSDGYKKRK